MSRDDLIRLYNITFDRIELLETYIEGNKSMFERLRRLRINYMDTHKFGRWSALDKHDDYHHLEWKDDVFGQIEAIVTTLRAQQKQLRLLERQLKLVVCILFGFTQITNPYDEHHRLLHSGNGFVAFPRLAEILGEEPEEKRLRYYDETQNGTSIPRIDWNAEPDEE